MEPQSLERSFSSYFNSKPKFIVRAPERVNLIGEHTDYNDGFVLPMAIDRAVWIALSSRVDSQIHIRSLDISASLNTSLETDSAFDLHSLTKGKGWAEYIKGVIYELQNAGCELKGFDAVITDDVPRGAGLSSSAAVELATARAFAVVSGFAGDAVQMTQLAQKAENEWGGVNCGIMDQMASSASREGYALFLDCRSLEYQCAHGQKNCYGARMTGAGFGGCAVALVKKEDVEEFGKAVSAAYKLRLGLDASIYVCRASEGASIVKR